MKKTTKSDSRKPSAKKQCHKKACKCRKGVCEISPKEAVSEMMKAAGDRLDALRVHATKAAEVLKFLVEGVKAAQQEYETVEAFAKALSDGSATLGTSLKIDVKKCSDLAGSIKDCVDRAMKAGDDEKGRVTMARMLIDGSSFRFPDGVVSFRFLEPRNGNAVVEFMFDVGYEQEIPGGKKYTQAHESFDVECRESLKETLADFDSKVAAMRTIRFEKKDCKRRGCGGKSCRCSENKQCKDEKPQPPTIDAIKRSLLFESDYAIPVKRFKVVADRVDTKSGKWVYELRFFQKDYTKSPIETQSYEAAPFRISMKGDTWTKAGRRFDKVVESLRFNTFKRKA